MFRLSLMALLMTLASPGADNFSLHIVSTKGDHIVAQPTIAPQFEFKVLGGNPKGYVYDCKQTTEAHARADHQDMVIVVECADSVRLELKGVSLQ